MLDYRHALFFAVKGVGCICFAAYASLQGEHHTAFTMLKVGLASVWIGVPVFAVLDHIAARSHS